MIVKSKLEEALECMNQVERLMSGRSYAEAYMITKKCEELMKAAKEKLIEKGIDETYPDLGYKIQVKKGKDKYKIPNYELIREIGQEAFNEIATVSQAQLERNVGHERYENLISLLVKDKEASEETPPYISVSKLNMEERKEVKSCPKRRRIAHKKED